MKGKWKKCSNCRNAKSNWDVSAKCCLQVIVSRLQVFTLHLFTRMGFTLNTFKYEKDTSGQTKITVLFRLLY